LVEFQTNHIKRLPLLLKTLLIKPGFSQPKAFVVILLKWHSQKTDTTKAFHTESNEYTDPTFYNPPPYLLSIKNPLMPQRKVSKSNREQSW